MNTENVKGGGQTKGEQVLVEHDKPAACCHDRSSKAVRKNMDSEEETTKQEPDDTPELNVSNVLLEAIKKLIGLFSLEDVKKALAVAEREL